MSDRRSRIAEEWSGSRPMSVCLCGHTGDGAGSQHAAVRNASFPEARREPGARGHGACEVPGCGCRQFSWRRWTPGFAEAIGDVTDEPN